MEDWKGGKAGSSRAYMPLKGIEPPPGRAWAPPTRNKFPASAQALLPDNYEALDQLTKCEVLDEAGLLHWPKGKIGRISARFDLRLLGELLIRPLTAYEKPAHPPTIRFYLEDGNHRALVYAVSLRLQTEAYQPVRAIFSRDWSHLYPWGQVTA